MRVEKLSGGLGAELIAVDHGNAFCEEGPLQDIRGLLQYKKLFLLDQQTFRPDYLGFAVRFGVVEDQCVFSSFW